MGLSGDDVDNRDESVFMLIPFSNDGAHEDDDEDLDDEERDEEDIYRKHSYLDFAATRGLEA